MDLQEELLKKDAQYVSPAEYRYNPVVVDKAEGSIITDVNGKEYIDFNSSCSSTNFGHRNSRVIEAAKEQMGKFIQLHPHVVYYEKLATLCERLSKLAEPIMGESKVFLMCSGSEAVEGALKLVRYATRKLIVLGFEHSFHGRATAGLGVTFSKAGFRKHLAPILAGGAYAPYAYCYRCPFGQNYPGCNMECLKYVRNLFKYVLPPEDVAAVIIEPIIGEGGYMVPPPEYLPGLKKICEENNLLFIADEVQTGYGRAGKMFAVEHWGVNPDVITLAKSMAGGFPLSAIIAKREIMDKWEPGAHGTTFGGHPVSCAAALAVLDILSEDNGKLLKQVEELGTHMMRRLKDLQERSSIVGDVRGKGLMIGVELVKDKKSKEPAPDIMKKIVAGVREKGLLIITCVGSTIRLMPPLTIAREELDRGIDILEEVILSFS